MNELGDLLKEEVSERVNEKVYYILEVFSIIKNLGSNISVAAVMKSLELDAVVPQHLGFTPHDYQVNDKSLLYKQSSIWSYLNRLNSEGKINLGSISAFEELINRSYHLGYAERINENRHRPK